MKIDFTSERSKGRFRYMAIVEAIADAIHAGRLEMGERLPAQRDLANQLGIAPGTVTRAYAEAKRRGLVAGKIGSGTYIVGSHGPGSAAESGPDQVIDFTLNRLHTGDGGLGILAESLQKLHAPSTLARLSNYQPGPGCIEHRVVGANWLERKGVNVSPEQIVICNGLQHGLCVILTALANVGDVVLTEELNYPGLKLLDGLFRVAMHGLSMDAHGLIPENLEKACQQSDKPKFLICTPSVHNPTNVTIPNERRVEIAKIAERYNLLIIELDEINGLLPIRPLRPFYELAPDRSVFVTSTWKSSEAGIAIGYIAAPTKLVAKLTAAVQATTWMPSPLLSEIVSAWIADGTAEKVSNWHHNEIAHRQQYARNILGDLAGQLDPISYNVWLKLPAPWRREYFVAEMNRRKVHVTPAEDFVVGRAIAPHAVRINLGGATNRALVERGLGVIAEAIHEGPRFDRMTA